MDNILGVIQKLIYEQQEENYVSNYIVGYGINGDVSQFKNCKKLYYPDASFPEYLIMVSDVSFHFFDYHSVNYCYKESEL